MVQTVAQVLAHENWIEDFKKAITNSDVHAGAHFVGRVQLCAH